MNQCSPQIKKKKKVMLLNWHMYTACETHWLVMWPAGEKKQKYWLCSVLFSLFCVSLSPEVRLYPDDFALLLLDDVLQVVQQGGAVTPAVRRNGAVQTGQLVQQRLLAPRTLQQLRLRYQVLPKFVSVSGKRGRITSRWCALLAPSTLSCMNEKKKHLSI